MTRFWIRVNARLADDADVRAFAKVLYPRLSPRLSVSATCGLLVSLWGRVIDEQEDGDVSGRDDDALEEWARWDGKRGVFAREFRERFTDAGRIREWGDYQGTLIERREKDRKRKAAARSSGSPADNPAEVLRTSGRNGNGNGHPVGSAPYGAESLQGAPVLAPAPEGARSPSPGTGNYQDNPATAEYLRSRGLRPDPDDPKREPKPIAEAEAESRSWADRYGAAMAEAADKWLAEHPEEAEQLEDEARANAHIKRGFELGPLAKATLRSAVHQLVAARLEWPSESEWVERKRQSDAA